MSTSTPPTIAIVGATGAVGREMLTVLEQRSFPHADIRLLASERSAGAQITYRGKPLNVAAVSDHAFDGVDIALFSAGSGTSKKYAPIAAAKGALVIDNSSAFRMDPEVPLVVPEINPDAMARTIENWRKSGWQAPAPRSMAQPGQGGIIANPNCSAIILLMALTPLRRDFGIDRAVVATYQAASGAGARAMDELLAQTRDVLEGRPPRRGEVFPEPYAFNLFSHNTPIDPATGQNVEEQKMLAESRKIWNDNDLRLAVTCIRVPVLRAHAQAVNITLSRPATTAQVRQSLAQFPGIRLIDDRSTNSFPTPLKASGGDEVLVGRIRPDSSATEIGSAISVGSGPAASPSSHTPPDETPTRGFDLFLCGDQLRKGAALNAIQIAEAAIQGLPPDIH